MVNPRSVLHHKVEVVNGVPLKSLVQFLVKVHFLRDVYFVDLCQMRINSVCQTREFAELTTHDPDGVRSVDANFHTSSPGTNDSDHNAFANLDGFVSFPRQDQQGFVPWGCLFDRSIRRWQLLVVCSAAQEWKGNASAVPERSCQDQFSCNARKQACCTMAGAHRTAVNFVRASKQRRRLCNVYETAGLVRRLSMLFG